MKGNEARVPVGTASSPRLTRRRARRAMGAGALWALAAALAPRVARGFGAGFEGTSSGEFLKLGADARAAGLSGAMSAASEDAAAIHWNPAGLAVVTQRHATLSAARYLGTSFHGFLAYAHPLETAVTRRRRSLRPSGLGTLAAGVTYFGVDKIAERDRNDQPTGGSVSARDVALTGAWGASVGRSLDLGIALKFVSSRLKRTASTGAVDAGARLRLRYGEAPIVLAAGGRNMGGRLRFRERADPLPLTYHAGVAARPFEPWLVSFEAAAPRDRDAYVSVGSEVDVNAPGDLRVALRGGYSNRVQRGIDGLRGLSFGAGVGAGAGAGTFSVDYGWSPYGILGHLHRFTLSYKF